jgi:hypothetical protein
MIDIDVRLISLACLLACCLLLLAFSSVAMEHNLVDAMVLFLEISLFLYVLLVFGRLVV